MLHSDISWRFLVYHVTLSMENCPSATERTVHCNNAAVYANGSVATGRASLVRQKYAEVGLYQSILLAASVVHS
jgi:hypothetical protein